MDGLRHRNQKCKWKSKTFAKTYDKSSDMPNKAKNFSRKKNVVIVAAKSAAKVANKSGHVCRKAKSNIFHLSL